MSVRANVFILTVVFCSLLSHSNASALQSYYEITKLVPTASEKMIETAYRKFMKRNPPDSYINDSAREQEVILKKEAFEVLRDPTRRKAYDLAVLNGNIEISPPTSFDPEQGWTVDFNHADVSERMVLEMATHTDKTIDGLIDVALKFLDREVDVPMSAENQTAVHQRAEVAYDIWMRAALWKNSYAGGRLDVIEAAYKAAFLYIKRFRAVHPEVFEKSWRAGASVSKGAELATNAVGNTEIRDIMIRVQEFLQQYKEVDWIPGPPLLPVECQSILAPEQASKN